MIKEKITLLALGGEISRSNAVNFDEFNKTPTKPRILHAFLSTKHNLLTTKYFKNMEKRKHFIALVPMGGKEQGKIAQHAYDGRTYKGAIEWAKERFSRPAIIIEIPWNELSLPIDRARDYYYTQMQ